MPDGSWSAPSAIATGGAGFGGQIGVELTDFVFILNDASAVKTFSQAGSLTLGGNVSLAAGPVGRNAEAAGAASLRSVAAIFSYSKTKGLFAGVSLEGSAIIERKDANTKLYGRPISARELLSGSERPPPEAAPLLNILNSRVFSLGRGGDFNDSSSVYNDIPVYDDRYDNGSNGRRGSSYGDRNSDRNSSYNGRGAYGGRGSYGDDAVRDSGYGSPSRDHSDGFGGPRRATTTASWRDDKYDDQPSRSYGGAGVSRSNTFNNGDKTGAGGASPGRPAAPKPNFASKQALLKKNEAVALFTFEADQPGDLPFKKGDIITVLKKTESDNDWW